MQITDHTSVVTYGFYFSYYLQQILWLLSRTVSPKRFKRVPTVAVLKRNMKISELFIWNFSCFGWKFSIYLNRRVFEMIYFLDLPSYLEFWQYYHFSDEARAKAIGLYRILAAVQILLGIGLLVCGGFGTTYTGEYDFGPPYFLGGFLVGSAVSTCLWAVIWGNIPSDVCMHRRLHSSCTSVQSDQSSLSAWKKCINGFEKVRMANRI